MSGKHIRAALKLGTHTQAEWDFLVVHCGSLVRRPA
jgi:hypothetical protein